MDIPAPITRIIPVPRPVRLGDGTYLASEFRTADLAALQAWIEDETPDPFDDVALAIAGGTRDLAWKRLLWGLIDGTEGYPPRVGDRDGDALIFSSAGLAFQLWLSLRRENPALTLADAARVLEDVSADQWGKFSRLAWGQTSRSILRGTIERAAGIDSRSAGGPADWSALWCSYVAKAGPGAPPFESLTLTQLRTWLADGDPDEKANEGEDGDGMWAEGYAGKLGAFWADIHDAPEVGGSP